MGCPQVQGNAGTFVVSGDDIDRNACVRDLDQGRHGHVHQRRWHFASIEKVAAVYNQVDLTFEGGLQSYLEIGKEVVASAPSLDPGAKRKVKTQVRVRNQEHSNDIRCQCGAAHRLPASPTGLG